MRNQIEKPVAVRGMNKPHESFLKSCRHHVIRCLIASISVLISPVFAMAGECTNIWYDASPDPNYIVGETYSIFLRNLLGHFPHRQTYIAPIESYRAGEIERCQASFYIGTHYSTVIPEVFLQDYMSTKKNVLWMGYGVWRLSVDAQKETLGSRYVSLTQLDNEKRDKKGRPTFFKTIRYKGENFEKYGDFTDKARTQFVAPFEQIRMEIVSPAAQVLAEARHNGTGEAIPYAIRLKNRFFVADVPFSFMHEGDRYLVFSDLLFDVLEEKPRYPGRRPAVFRLEDIHARVPQYQVYDIAAPLKELGVPLHIALIPIFYDPLNKFGRAETEEMILMHQDRYFLQMLSDIKSSQTTRFIWHGVTHQFKKVKNPHSAISGDDFEFWDIKRNKPIEGDSVRYVLNRLDDGWETLEKSGIKPLMWEVPHYQASMLDYTIFARVFPWNVGRIMYAPYEAKGVPDFARIESARYDRSGLSGRQARFDAFRSLQVAYDGTPNGQFFPYEIYGDHYGQRVIPENLGNPQPFQNEHVTHPRSVDEIIEAARKNMKLRDTWGSLFFHPQLTNTTERDGIGSFPGDSAELRRLVNTMRELGYEFIDLDEFIARQGDQRRPDPIVIPRSSAVSHYQTLTK